MSVNYVQQLPEGICFAHGPYKDTINCPQWPACASDPQQPEFIRMGTEVTAKEKQVVLPDCQPASLSEVRLAELERKVVETAVNWSDGMAADYATSGDLNELLDYEQPLFDAVTALIAAREKE